MDCNMRSPLQWEWENWLMFNPSQPETHKRQLLTEWGVEKGEGIESLVPCFSGFDGVSSGSGANLWHTALSKSSQSTSVNSSPHEVKTSKLVSEAIPEDSCSNIDVVQAKASPAFEVSVGSAESLLGLKLGKRTYFEDICGGNNVNISAVPMGLTSSVTLKKSKSSGQTIQIPRCQVEGCDLDLSSAKDYHRKHRVCESHSKCPKVIVSGLERRFCQQCSRFHALLEFDGKKRSCRKRLSHHNARRRKPQQGVFPLNPARIYDRRQHTSFVWNGLWLNSRSEEKLSWEGPCGTKPMETGGITLSFQKGNHMEDQQLTSNNSHSLNSIGAFQGASGFSAEKSNIISFQVPGKGEFPATPGLSEAQDFHRALSLLSNTSYNSSEAKCVPPSRYTTDPEPTLQPMSDAFPSLFHMNER